MLNLPLYARFGVAAAQLCVWVDLSEQKVMNKASNLSQ